MKLTLNSIHRMTTPLFKSDSYYLDLLSYREWKKNQLKGFTGAELLDMYTKNEHNMPLTIDKEKVLKAASECPQAKQALKTLFPEVFEEDKYLEIDKLEFWVMGNSPCIFLSANVSNNMNHLKLISKRETGNFANKSFFLSDLFDWRLERDCYDTLCLVPTRK